MLKVCCRNCSEEECECVCECECDCECCSSGFECSRKCFFTWIYVLITVALLVSATVIFKAFPTTDKANTPEKSRNENVECIWLGFFDYRDLWQILSSFALLMGAHLLMYAGYTAPSNARGKSSSDRSEGQDNDIPLEWLCVGLLSHRRKERLTHWNVNIRLNRIRRTAHLKSLKRISDLYISFLQTLVSFVLRSDFNASNSTTAKKITKLTNQRLLTKFRTNLHHQHGILGWLPRNFSCGDEREEQTTENCLAKLLQNCLAWRQNVYVCQFRLFSFPG